jgi:hypothetical protein
VHDALGVAEVESLEQLKDVETDVKVGEFRVQSLELGVLEGGTSAMRDLLVT